MPLHDWNNPAGWEGVHDIWIVELLRWIKPRLPEGYRAYIGSTPALTVGATEEKPDVAVRQWLPELPPASTAPPEPADELPAPQIEVATLELDPQTAVYVAYHNRMVAALELVSPRNKDRPSSRAFYLARYLGYLREEAHLLLVDVHRRPLNFSFADAMAKELDVEAPPLSSPLVMSYRVDGPAATGGRHLTIWRHSLAPGKAIPSMPLPIVGDFHLMVNLEATYTAAAEAAYLS